MRVALVLSFSSAVLLAGCRTVPVAPQTRESEESLVPQSRYVSLPKLADNLRLDLRQDRAGYFELSDPPDTVFLVPDSRRALVNGRAVPMDQPCMLRGVEYVLTSGDAERVRTALLKSRATRPEPEPDPLPVPPRVAPRRPDVLPSVWRPRAKDRDWKYIVVHHSASVTDSARKMNKFHVEVKHWEMLGYHFVIGNGSLSGDGEVEVGPRWRRQLVGAHAKVPGNLYNRKGIGIALVGHFNHQEPSPTQMRSLVTLVRALMAEYGIPPHRVVKHSSLKATDCPGVNFPWEELQEAIR